jgi:hypothetical protein
MKRLICNEGHYSSGKTEIIIKKKVKSLMHYPLSKHMKEVDFISKTADNISYGTLRKTSLPSSNLL